MRSLFCKIKRRKMVEENKDRSNRMELEWDEIGDG
jgi:hypothetical protein